MTNRTTMRELEGLVNRLNNITGNKQSAYTQDNKGKFTANIGTYYLDGAYGGWKLVQIVNEGGGIRSITTGYESKKILYGQICAYINGIGDCIRAEKEHNETIDNIVKG